MKKISKTHPPVSFRKWLDENRLLDCSYETLVGKPAHIALKKQLLKEQGFLCAYTGLEISESTSHVEHLKPQNKCVDHEDVEYRNMVACFPYDGGNKSFGFGAPVKGGWWKPEDFISPLTEECERRFSFAWSGKIRPEPADHKGAKETIKNIGLGHENLKKLRLAAIKGFFGFGGRLAPISKREAEILLRSIDKTDNNGKFRPFCFVLKQLLPLYIAGAHP